MIYGEIDIDKPETFLRRARYYYGMFENDQTSIPYFSHQNKASFSNINRRTPWELRSYAKGLQPIEKYQKACGALVPKGRKNAGKNTWNISWQPINVWPKFRNILKDKFTSLLLEPNTEAVDDMARIEKIFTKNLLKLTANPATQIMTGKTSPVEEEDVNYIYQMGAVKLESEILMKDVVDDSLEKSRMKMLAEMFAEDIIDLNQWAAHIYADGAKQKIEYVDPARCIVRTSIYPDHRDSDFRGFCWTANVMDAIKRFDLNKGEVTQIHAGRVIQNSIQDVGVEVMTMYFLDTVQEKYVKGIRPNGARQYERVPLDFKPSKSLEKAGKVVEDVEILYLYKLDWFVGTNVIRYERLDEITKNSALEILWPVVIYNGHEPSLGERVVGFDDDIQIANYKLRQAIATLPPAPRMMIFKDAISETVRLNGEDYSILDMMAEFQSRGIWVADSNTPYQFGNETNQKRPIEFLPAGIVDDYQLFTTRITECVNNIRQVTGINEITDGSSRQQDMLQSVMSNLAAATNSAISPYVNMYVEGYKDICNYVAFTYQRNNPKLAKHEWWITVTLQTQEDKQVLLQMLMQYQQIIGADAFFVVSNMIAANDLKKAQSYLGKYIQKSQERQHAQQIEVAQATAKGNENAAVAMEAEKRKTTELEIMSKGQLMEIESRLNKEFEKFKHDLLMGEIEKKSQLDTEREERVVRANNQNRLAQ